MIASHKRRAKTARKKSKPTPEVYIFVECDDGQLYRSRSEVVDGIWQHWQEGEPTPPERLPDLREAGNTVLVISEAMDEASS